MVESETPTSAALKFVQQSNARRSNDNGTEQSNTSPAITKTPTAPKKRSAKTRKPSATVPTVEAPYQPFSTRLRSDLKRRLKRLSHEREDQGAEVKSVQQFVEEAILMWLESQEDAP